MVIDTFLAEIFVIIGCVCIAMLGLVIARRIADLNTLRECHEVGGYLLSVVGTLYAVLLGLVVVDAMTKFQSARVIVEQEANCLADVFLLSEHMPAQKRDAIQKLCISYVDEVISKEWPAMDNGNISPEARNTAIKLMRTVSDFEPQSTKEQGIYPIIVQQTTQLWDNRRARTNYSQYGIPTPEWVVLILGAIVTTVFTYFFGLENIKVQVIMTGLYSLLIGLNLYLVLMFGYPFSGDVRVWPDAFTVDKQIFTNQIGWQSNSKQLAPEANPN